MNRIRSTKDNRGTTLAELLAYLGVTSILFITLTTFVANLGQGIRRNTVKRELTEVGRTALNSVSNEIRRAKDITNVVASTVTLTRPDDTTVTIAFTGTMLTLTDSAGTKPLNEDDVRVTNATFSRSGDSVNIDFSVEPTTPTPGIQPLDLASVATVRRLYY